MIGCWCDGNKKIRVYRNIRCEIGVKKIRVCNIIAPIK